MRDEDAIAIVKSQSTLMRAYGQKDDMTKVTIEAMTTVAELAEEALRNRAIKVMNDMASGRDGK